MPTTHCEVAEQDFPFADSLDGIITDVRRRSGRYDLSDDDIIGYLNDAQKHLDRVVRRRQQRTQNLGTILAGAVCYTFSSRCRVIERVYAIQDCNRIMLRRITWREMRGHLRKVPQTGANCPIVYAEAMLHREPGYATLSDLAGPLGFQDTIFSPAGKCNGIFIHPPTTQEITIEVIGNWYDDILTVKWPYSWWIVNHADLLVKATLRELEIYMRNSQGVSDYDMAIATDLKHVDFDQAEQDSVGIDRIMA